MTELSPSLSRDDAAEVQEIDRLGMAGAEGVAALISRLDHPSWAVRRAVIAALARMGAPAVDPLCRLLATQRGHEGRLAAAVDALSASRADADAAVIALTAPGHPAPVIFDAAQILGRRRSLSAVETLDRLTRHADDNVAVSAIEALGRIGSGVGADALISLIESKNFFRTFPAIDVLGRSGDPRAVPTLLALLDDPLYASEATRGLGVTGDLRAIAPLIALMVRSHERLVREAAVALAEIHRLHQDRFGATDQVEQLLAESSRGKGVVGNLLSALTGADEHEQIAAALFFGWHGGEQAAGALLPMLAGPRPIADAAMTSLRRLGRAIEHLLPVWLREADSAQRLRLLPLVAGKSGGLEEVAACLRDPEPAVRTAACEALARSGDTTRIDNLFSLLADEDLRTAQAALAAVQSLGSPRTESLALAACRSTNPIVRRAALRIVSYFGYANGLAPLLEALDDTDDRLREVATAGLAYFDAPRALEALLGAATHAAPKTRAAAVRALGNVATDGRVQVCLRNALRDPDAWVRYYACQSLGKLRDDSATEAIVQLVDDPAGQVRVAVIDALAQMRSPAAAQALERAAVSPNLDVRRAALVGLGVARRPSSLPAVVDAMASTDAATRLVALAAIAEYDAPQVIPALRRGAADADLSVASAAIGLLANRPGSAATDALIDLLALEAVRAFAVAALARPLDGRVGAILAALETDSGARAPWLVAALARMGSPEADAALVLSLKAPLAAARRATARALAGRATPEVHSALAAAATDDPDPDVRRIAILALSALAG